MRLTPGLFVQIPKLMPSFLIAVLLIHQDKFAFLHRMNDNSLNKNLKLFLIHFRN